MTAALVRDADLSVLRLSVPAKGRVLTTVAETYGKPIWEAIQTLTRSLARERPTVPGWLSREIEIGAEAATQPSAGELAARHICTQWVLGVALRRLAASDDLETAARWFAPESDASLLSVVSAIPGSIKARALSHLRTGAAPDAWAELLPYVLDSQGPGSRLSVMRDPSTRATRDRKRTNGSFYTPADVADFMVGAVIANLKAGVAAKVLDPACGTGVFLRSALSALHQRHPSKDISALAEDLFGIDIDLWAIHASAYVLLHDILAAAPSSGGLPHLAWQRFRQNLHVGDALSFDPANCKLNDANPLSRVFPALNTGPNVIVGNPPYARVGERVDLLRLAKRFQTLRPASSTSEIHPLFVEQMMRLAAPDATAALVLPLSIGFNTRPQFVAARRLIERTAGTWRFSFFDREPHALFGEDVKTRNAVIVWTRHQDAHTHTVMTTPLLKWRGESRARMFRSIQHTRIGNSIINGVPKIGSTIEADALSGLSEKNILFGDYVPDMQSCTLREAFNGSDTTMFVSSTAYNFINAFLRPPKQFKNIDILSNNKIHLLKFPRLDDVYIAYALLSSRTAFWLWHVLGDGFHVTRTNIEGIPLGMSLFGRNQRGGLAALGAQLWQEAKAKPLVSNNRGRFSLAFPNLETSLLHKVDGLISVAADLPNAFSDALDTIVNSIISAEPLRRFHSSANEDVTV